MREWDNKRGVDSSTEYSKPLEPKDRHQKRFSVSREFYRRFQNNWPTAGAAENILRTRMWKN